MTQNPDDSPKIDPATITPGALRLLLKRFLQKNGLSPFGFARISKCDKEAVVDFLEDRRNPHPTTLGKIINGLNNYSGATAGEGLNYCPTCGQSLPAKHTHRKDRARPAAVKAAKLQARPQLKKRRTRR